MMIWSRRVAVLPKPEIVTEMYQLALYSGPAAAGEASVWVRALTAQHAISQEWAEGLDLCVVELLGNIADYAYVGGPGEIRLTLEIDEKHVALIIEDDGPAFDPLQKESPVAPTSLDTASIGGLGIHLVRQFAHACHYERRNHSNRLEVYFGEVEQLPRQADRRRKPPAPLPVARCDGTWVETNERSGIDRRALGFISHTELFRNVPYAELELIVAGCRIIRHAAGDMVVAAGQQSHRVLVVIEGALHVHIDSPDSPDYIDVPCGECVGEISVADGKRATAWVMAASDCRLLEIDADTFLNRLLSIPSVGRNLISILAERMRRNNQRMVDRLRMELELKSLHRELDFARRIQSSMLPANPLLPEEPRLDCQGFMRAARHVGGDFYDAFRLDDNNYLFAIGDVCNKGMPAALFMSQALAILRSLAIRFLSHPEVELQALVAAGNDQLCRMNSEQLFVSVFITIVDLERGEMRFVNAGHNAPILILPGEPPRFIEENRNPIAGMVPGLAFRADRLEFPRGAALLLYTDGVTEAETANGDLFGDGPLIKCANSSIDTAAALIEGIINLVDEHSAGHPQADDITLLAVRRNLPAYT